MLNKYKGKKGKNPGHNLDPSASSTPSRGRADGTLVIKGKAFDCYMEDFKLLYRFSYTVDLKQMIHEPTGHIMTVKGLHVSSTNERKMFLNALNDFVVRNVDCPHITTVYGVMAEKEKVWICMEPMRARMSDLFKKLGGRRIPEEVLREMAIAVLRALKDLQNLSIPHQGFIDVWLDNILVDDKANFRFCVVPATQHQWLVDDPTEITKMQIFKLGFILIRFATGKDQETLPADEPCSDEFRDFVAQCKSRIRPSYALLLEDAFIKQSNEQSRFDSKRWVIAALQELEQHQKIHVIPPEITVRGRLPLEAYKKALDEGKTCDKRVPVMLIGQDRSGKTSLKKSLRGQPFNPDEESTVRIDVDPSHFKLSTEIWKIGEKEQESHSETSIFYEYHVAGATVDNLKEGKKVPSPEEGVPETKQSGNIPVVDQVAAPVSLPNTVRQYARSDEMPNDPESVLDFRYPEQDDNIPKDVETEIVQRLKNEAPIAEAVQDVESSSLITSDGGLVSVKSVTLICPPGAVDDPVVVKLILEEPCKYCGLILNHGLENDLKFGSPIINCQPNRQTFKKHVKFKIALDSEIKNVNEAYLVLHGTPSGSRKICWENITHNSKFDLEKKELSVNMNHFSLIAVLVRLAWVRTKEIATRLNLISFKYMLSVLFKSNHRNLPCDELAFVFMSQDIYKEQFYREHDDSALMKLKNDGFEELCSNVRKESGFIYNNENLTVSVQLGEDYKLANNQQERITFAVDSSVWWSTGHVVKLPLQAFDIDAKILCGRIVVESQYGHVGEDHFCQQDLCGYVRRFLGVENATFNLKPLTIKLGLSKETPNEDVTCWQSEAKQLEMILLRWQEAHKDTDDFAELRKALGGLQPEDYKVKERGQMHIDHLRELAVTIVGLQHTDPSMTKYLGNEIKTLCSSILRDCCIELATSKEDLELATSTENCTSLLESYRQIPGDVAKKCKRLCITPEESIAADFLVIVPLLSQAIKEIFRDEKVPHQQSGLRGVSDETALQKFFSDIQKAAKNKDISRLFCEVSYILEHLCLNNNGNRSTENEIRQWGGSNMIITMLQFLEKFFQSSEEQRLYKRLHLFSVAIRDIMSDPTAFEGNFLRDFLNVALSLLKFAKFDPSQLVRFELSDPTNSCHTQGNDGLKYDTSKDTFSQLFWIRKESDDELQLEAIANVHMNGLIRSIGAFESFITLPESCSMGIDRALIGFPSVVVKRELDDSGNLRVTLYATHKEKISKAFKYLESELGADVIDLSQIEITPSQLKMRSFAKEGVLVSLRLVHKWGSEALALASNDFVALADSTSGGASVPDPEIAALSAEINQLAVSSKLPALPGASDSTVRNYSSNFGMDGSNAEWIQKQFHERGHVEVHYHQNFLRGHVCVAGKNTSMNMQLPSTEQRSLEAGPSDASHSRNWFTRSVNH